ncbi:unnamed protein product, partial [marine sediment metagenome]
FVAITLGDPAGIGPEITLKVLKKREIYDLCVPVVLGAPWVLQEHMPAVRESLKVRIIHDVKEALGVYGTIDLLETGSLSPGTFLKGEVSAAAGLFSGQCLESAVSLALRGEVYSVLLPPINKQSLNAGGYHFAGWAEMVKHMTGAQDALPVLIGERYNLARVTTHVSLRQVPDLIPRERVRKVILMLDQSLKAIGYKRPRIAVSCLNPHFGEGGLFGREEIDSIIPAIEDVREEGVEALGPFPGDTIFLGMRDGNYDIVLSMYHDHGGAAIKLLEFGHLVNFLAGVPIRIFSVAHGTAFDIVGKGIADAGNLERSLRFASGVGIPACRSRSGQR